MRGTGNSQNQEHRPRMLRTARPGVGTVPLGALLTNRSGTARPLSDNNGSCSKGPIAPHLVLTRVLLRSSGLHRCTCNSYNSCMS